MHTTEHILNAVMQRDFGTGRSVGAHFGEKKSKCDYVINRPLSEEDLRKIEAAVNGARFRAFAENRKVQMTDLLKEIEMTTPTAQTHEEDVQKMREWANKFARNSQKGNNDD